MSFITGCLYYIVQFFDMGLTVGMWLIIIRTLISWVQPDNSSSFMQFLCKTTEPALNAARKFMSFINCSTIYDGVDFSPVIAVLGVLFIKMFVMQSLLAALR